MKKLLSFFAILSLLLAGCSGFGEDENQGNGGAESVVKELFDAADLAKLVDFKAEAGRVLLPFTPEYDWTATSSDESWITVNPTSGVAGEKVELKVMLAANTSTDSRRGKVRVALNDANNTVLDIPVSQKGVDPVLNLVDGNNGVYSIDGSEQVINVTVETNIDKAADVYIQDSSEWLTVYEGETTRAMHTDIIALHATKNDTGDVREAKVTIYYGNEEANFTVRQEPAQEGEPSISVTPAVCDASAEGGEVVLNVFSNTDWTVACDAGDVTVAPASGNGDGKVTVALAATDVTREVEVKFTATLDGKTKEVVAKVKQTIVVVEEPVVRLVDGATYSVDCNGGVLDVKVETNIESVAEVDIQGGASWLTQFSGAATRAMRTDLITLKAEANTTGSARQAKVTVYYGNKFVDFLVTQESAQLGEPSISVTPGEAEVSAEGGSIELNVFSNTDWTVACYAGDVTIDPKSGNGDGKVTVTLAATDVTREVEVKFTAALDGKTKVYVVKVKQTVKSNEGGDDGEGGDDLTDSQLTPYQHQANLKKTGEDLLQYFNPEDCRVLVTSVTELGNAGGFNFHLDETRGVKSQSLKSHNLIKQIFTSVLGVAKFSPKSASRLSASLTFPEEGSSYDLEQLKGSEYVFNFSTGTWKQNAGVHAGNKMTAVWGTSVATLTWVDGTNSWEGNISYDYKAKLEGVPSKFNVEIAVDGNVEFAAELNVSVPNNYAIDTKTAITLNGGYAFSVVAKADSQSVEGSVTIAKNGTKIIDGGGKVYINDMTNSANWWKEYEDSWYDGSQWQYETWTDFNWAYPVNKVKTGQAYATILNVGLRAQGDLRTILDEGTKIEDTTTQQGATLLSNCINKNASAVLYYVDSKEKIANVAAEAIAYEEWVYSGETGESQRVTYYDAAPVIVFADGSKWAIDDYFTEAAFGTLLDSAESLWDRYMELMK